MIETLYKYLGNMPLVGQPIKLAYIGKKVKDCVKNNEDRKLDPETAGLAGGELNNYANELATKLFDDEVLPHIHQTGLPDVVISPVKNKAIGKLTQVITNQIQKKITTKQ